MLGLSMEICILYVLRICFSNLNKMPARKVTLTLEEFRQIDENQF